MLMVPRQAQCEAHHTRQRVSAGPTSGQNKKWSPLLTPAHQIINICGYDPWTARRPRTWSGWPRKGPGKTLGRYARPSSGMSTAERGQWKRFTACCGPTRRSFARRWDVPNPAPRTVCLTIDACAIGADPYSFISTPLRRHICPRARTKAGVFVSRTTSGNIITVHGNYYRPAIYNSQRRPRNYVLSLLKRRSYSF